MKPILTLLAVTAALGFVVYLNYLHSTQLTADLPFIKNIDFNRFQGRWYEIASKPNVIEKKCKCGQSVDTLKTPLEFELSESCMILGKNVTSKSSIKADGPGLGNFTNWNGPL